MKQSRTTHRVSHPAALPLSPLFLLLSRLTLAFTALLLAVMPFSEQFGTWDRFLRGGEDLELGLLATIAVLALLLLLAQNSRGALSEHSAALADRTDWLFDLFGLPTALVGPESVTSATIGRQPRLKDSTGYACPPPLRI